MDSEKISIDKCVFEQLLSTRKMSIDMFASLIEIDDENVIFPSFESLQKIAKDISFPVSEFFRKRSNDLNDGVKIARRDETYKRDEFRQGNKYYTYHHLVTTNAEPSLMALRLDLLCDKKSKIILNKGHNSKELVYVTKGEVQVQWENENGKLLEEMLNEGDSIFVSPGTPHSFSAINSDSPAEIIAVNYG